MNARERAVRIVAQYGRLSGPNYNEPPQTELEDLMADLRHHAAHQGLDWVKAVDMAEIHYEEERGEQT